MSRPAARRRIELVPRLIGETFLGRWGRKTAGDLFEWVRGSMPPGQDARLSPQEYADVLACVFSRNAFPAGIGAAPLSEEKPHGIDPAEAGPRRRQDHPQSQDHRLLDRHRALLPADELQRLRATAPAAGGGGVHPPRLPRLL